MVEHSTADREVLGSTPSAPSARTFLPFTFFFYFLIYITFLDEKFFFVFTHYDVNLSVFSAELIAFTRKKNFSLVYKGGKFLEKL